MRNRLRVGRQDPPAQLPLGQGGGLPTAARKVAGAIAAAIDGLRARGFRVMPAGARAHKVVRGDRTWHLSAAEIRVFAGALPPVRPRTARPKARGGDPKPADIAQASLFDAKAP